MIEAVLVSYGAVSALGTCAFLAWGWARGRKAAADREVDVRVYTPIVPEVC